MSAYNLLESLKGTEFYRNNIKLADVDKTEKLANRCFLGINCFYSELAKRLKESEFSCEVLVSSYAPASPLGIRWSFVVRENQNEEPLLTVFLDWAARELIYSNAYSFPPILDEGAFSSDAMMRSKAESHANDWAQWILSKVSGSEFTPEYGMDRDNCLHWHREEKKVDPIINELNTFVADLPVPFTEGGLLALQYEAQMMDFLYNNKHALELESEIPKVVKSGEPKLDHSIDDSSTYSHKGGKWKDQNVSGIEVIEKNHKIDFLNILKLYFGIHQVNPIIDPSTFYKLQEELMIFNQFFLPFIYRPGRDLSILWQRLNLVHNSLTALTHQKDAIGFSIKWHEKLKLGVIDHSTYIRNLNEGVKYPNISMSGLRDFEHVIRVRRDQHGFSAFAKSITELVILSAYACVVNKIIEVDANLLIKVGLAEILASRGCQVYDFCSSWDNEKLGELVHDIIEGKKTDQLDLRRFVRAAELFILSLEKLI